MNREKYNNEKEMKHISPTQIKTYISCGRRYFYRYVEARKPENVHYTVPFGRAFHQVIAEINIYRKQKKQIETGMASDWFEEFFNREIEFAESEISFEGKNKEGLIFTAKSMLVKYMSFLSSLKTEVLNVEYGVSCPVAGTDYVFEGVIDSVESDSSRVYLVEVKTAGRLWSEEMVRFDLQAPLYKSAVRSFFPQKDIILRYDIITRNRNVKFESRHCISEGEAHLNMMKEIITGIEKGVYTPKPSYQCKGCEYNKICWEELS